ncbi:pectinesterase-like [Nicotiana tabacum]|uniref:Pectinesterase n=1 Tax=Nicotiana tabacum TaxID=4097 RepID=A0A1S4CY74_TOBAC|nr:PREDICTED: probable pectinesterase/pectinesterase inhibitor 20 [Nicotiana tabacum]
MANVRSLLPVLMLFSFCFPANAISPLSSESFCSYTHFPEFCKYTLPINNSATIQDYGRLSLHHSLSMNDHLLSLVNGYLFNLRYALPESTIRALEDCQLLCSLNHDFILSAIQSIHSTNTLERLQAEDVQPLLSAILTNQETCSDGLKEVAAGTSVTNMLLSPLSDGTKSFSVSLALFMHGWGYSAISEKKFPFSGGRKLLQSNEYGVNVNQRVVVNPDGSGNFTTINEAVAAAPNYTAAGNGYFLIHVVAGVYEEYVSIPSNKRYIMMTGDGINMTIITGNRSVADGWTTFNSATFAVTGKGFVAMNITFRNTAGSIRHQAVAIRNGADMSTFYGCNFEGYQDTLYTHSLRQFYRECDIYGTVDFIFGNAAVVLQNCNIYPRLPMPNQFNAITAQGRTDINQNTGISVQNCSIKAAQDLASTQTFLGRPWKEYSRTVYIQSFMDSLIDPSGWSPWSGDFALNTLYYAEYANTGPGSVTTNRVTWQGYHVINDTDAVNFTVSSLIQGDVWLPATGVPFTSGLL